MGEVQAYVLRKAIVLDSIIKFDSKPVLNNPIFVECLPGIGGVGKIAGDFVADALKAERFATIYSKHLPSQVLVDKDNIAEMACNELWYARAPKGDVIFLRGDYQGNTPEGQFILAQDVMEILLPYGVTKIVTLGGYGTGMMPEEVHVYGAVTDKSLKRNLKRYGVTFSPGEPQAGIVGAAALFLGFGKMNGIPSLCLMGETSGYFADQKSALAVIAILKKVLGVRKKFNTKELEEQSKKIDELADKVNNSPAEQEHEEDLSYIG